MKRHEEEYKSKNIENTPKSMQNTLLHSYLLNININLPVQEYNVKRRV